MKDVGDAGGGECLEITFREEDTFFHQVDFGNNSIAIEF